MKITVICFLCLALMACNSQKSGTAGGSALKLASKKDTLSYSIGMSIGKDLKKKSVPLDSEIFTIAFKDGYGGGKTVLTDEQANAAVNAANEELMAKRADEAKELGKKAQAFLDENKKRPDVVTTASGLQYKILKTGTGKKPKAGQMVKVHYIGKFVDGTEFDSSIKRGRPADLQVGAIPLIGWNEALLLMPVGSKWELYLPPNLAYGDHGSSDGRIAPNATLIFDVELLSIQ